MLPKTFCLAWTDRATDCSLLCASWRLPPPLVLYPFLNPVAWLDEPLCGAGGKRGLAAWAERHLLDAVRGLHNLTRVITHRSGSTRYAHKNRIGAVLVSANVRIRSG